MRIEIKTTGSVSARWRDVAKNATERTLDFMNFDTAPSVHLVAERYAVPTPRGSQIVAGGYDPKSQEVVVSISWIEHRAAQLPPPNIEDFDVGEKLMTFIIAHEVCHYVQDRLKCLPPPDASVGLFVTDLDRYDNLPHEREANVVAWRMAPGLRTPTMAGPDMIQYLQRDPKLRGTGFPSK